MFLISKDYRFSAAHRLEGHPKCGRLHGHNYLLQVWLAADELEDGMVMDFNDVGSIIKDIVGDMDHRYLVSEENLQQEDIYVAAANQSMSREDDLYFLRTDRSTAECIAETIYTNVTNELVRLGFYSRVWIEKVVLWETSKSQATYIPS